MSSSSPWSPSPRVKASIAVWSGLLGVLMIWAGQTESGTPDSVPVAAPRYQSLLATPPSAPTAAPARPTTSTHQADVRDQISGRVLPESLPVALSIPRIGVRTRLVELGLDDDGTMKVPPDPSLAGWFSRGAAPGALGPAVIAGHVTWDGAPGVFRRLGTLQHGDSVVVTREDGKTAVFKVSRVARFSKSQFPSRSVYGAINYAGLRLITCGGTYDAAKGRYVDNVVVFAKLATVREPRG